MELGSNFYRNKVIKSHEDQLWPDHGITSFVWRVVIDCLNVLLWRQNKSTVNCTKVCVEEKEKGEEEYRGRSVVYTLPILSMNRTNYFIASLNFIEQFSTSQAGLTNTTMQVLRQQLSNLSCFIKSDV